MPRALFSELLPMSLQPDTVPLAMQPAAVSAPLPGERANTSTAFAAAAVTYTFWPSGLMASREAELNSLLPRLLQPLTGAPAMHPAGVRSPLLARENTTI